MVLVRPVDKRQGQQKADTSQDKADQTKDGFRHYVRNGKEEAEDKHNSLGFRLGMFPYYLSKIRKISENAPVCIHYFTENDNFLLSIIR
jgi:hypothetical protein